jgi:hypothetical protein
MKNPVLTRIPDCLPALKIRGTLNSRLEKSFEDGLSTHIGGKETVFFGPKYGFGNVETVSK